MDIKKKIRNKKIADANLAIRKKLWPKIKDGDIWQRKTTKGYSAGFATIPRTLPIFMVIMDHLSATGKPVSRVYFDLWCRAWDNPLIRLINKDEMALFGGHTSQRGVSQWRDKVKMLHKLGFIELAPGASGEVGVALLLNPYKVVKRIRLNNKDRIPERLYNSLLMRAKEIGADDI